MKILMIGDINGRAGREALAEHLPVLRAAHKPVAVIVNVDNASHGRGITPDIAKEIAALGADIMTGGDHIWDQNTMMTHLDRSPFVLRPLNYPTGTVGKGWHIITAGDFKILVVHAMGRVFVERQSDNPFVAMDQLLQKFTLKKDVDAIVVDFHAEATSEKNAMGLHMDGRVSAVVGTHTHVPTADARILPQGTGYITDLGMTGDYNSIIGADKAVPLQKFVGGFTTERMKPAEGIGTVCGVVITVNEQTGLTQEITPFRVGATALGG